LAVISTSVIANRAFVNAAIAWTPDSMVPMLTISLMSVVGTPVPPLPPLLPVSPGSTPPLPVTVIVRESIVEPALVADAVKVAVAGEPAELAVTVQLSAAL